MNHWHAGSFKAILEEGRAIQGRLIRSKNRMGNDNDARRFAELMMKGKLREATRLLSGNGRVLPLGSEVDDGTTVRDILRDKHPDTEPLKYSAIAPPSAATFHPVIFEEITGTSILKQLCTQMAVQVHQVWMPMHGDAFADPFRKHQPTSVKHWPRSHEDSATRLSIQSP